MLVFLAGCASKLPVRYVPVQSTTEIKQRPVEVPIPADSASLLALFECDSLNQVILKQLNETRTSGMHTDFDFDKGQLIYKTRTLRDTITVMVTDTVYREQVPIEVPVPYEVNKLKWWQTGFMVLGVAFIFFILIALISKLLTNKFI